MFSRRLSLVLWCASAGLFAFVMLDFWSERNSPLYKKLESQWSEDVETLERSGKMPAAWFDVSEIELFGGTPETKGWLKRIEVPVRPNKEKGRHKLEVLVVVWEEEGKHGALIQYNLVDLKSQNMIFELGRTLILSENEKKPSIETTFKDLIR